MKKEKIIKILKEWAKNKYHYTPVTAQVYNGIYDNRNDLKKIFSNDSVIITLIEAIRKLREEDCYE